MALVAGLAALAPLVGPGGASPSPETTIVLEQLPYTFSSPVFVTAPPGDESRLFVVQQGNGGLSADIKLVYQGAMTTFLTVDGILSGGARSALDGVRARLRDEPALLRLLHRLTRAAT